MIQTKFEFLPYSESTKIKGNCNAITFYNLSVSDPMTINGLPVGVGSFVAFECNQNEIDTTDYQIGFGTSTTGYCLVVKKVFV